jgi:hypothetical protein
MLSIALITKSQVMWNMIFLTQRRNGSMTKKKLTKKKWIILYATTLNDDDDDDDDDLYACVCVCVTCVNWKSRWKLIQTQKCCIDIISTLVITSKPIWFNEDN